MKKQQKLSFWTTSQGAPVDDTQNSLTVGQYGPVLIQDFQLIDKLAHFDRQRIPQRVVHAKGAGAHGYFECTHNVTQYCKANPFQKIGKRTPIFVRFSTVGGEKGSADTARDPRGFAIKFYTEEGNWDMTGNNTPVFFIRDPSMFPDFIHTQKRVPQTNLPSAQMAWDFWSLVPQSCHQVTILFSDRGTPDGYRHMNGYSSHTFKWVNSKGECFWIKLHVKTCQGNLTGEKADLLKGTDPDYATRDLFNFLQNGKVAEWNFMYQIMPENDGFKYKWNIFDVTKVWPHGDYPLQYLGKIFLNKNPENYFQEVEQSAFSPGHLIPGIEPSLDKMLQGRLFSYPDTHRHRLGPNYQQIPINAPRNKVHNSYRDGPMCVNGNQGNKPNYQPNSMKIFQFRTDSKYAPYRVTGMVGRFKPAHPNDDFAQPGTLYRKVMNDKDKSNLITNMSKSMKSINRDIQERAIRNFHKCDAQYGDRLAKALGLPAIGSKL